MVGTMCEGPVISCASVGDRLNEIGGRLAMAFRMAWMGLGCVIGKVPLVDVGKLGFICFSVITSGLNG